MAICTLAVGFGLALGNSQPAASAPGDAGHPPVDGGLAPGWSISGTPGQSWDFWAGAYEYPESTAYMWSVAVGDSPMTTKAEIDKWSAPYEPSTSQSLVPAELRVGVPQMAYIHGQTQQGAAGYESTADNRAAAALLAHFNYQYGDDADEKLAWLVKESAQQTWWPDVKAAMIRMIADANTSAMDVGFDFKINGNGSPQGTVTVTAPKNANGQTLAGKDYTLTLGGPAEFSNGTNTISGRSTTAETTTQAWTATGTGKVSLGYKWTDVPEAVFRYTGTVVGASQPAVILSSVGRTGFGGGTAIQVGTSFQPMLTSNVCIGTDKCSRLVDGNTITDYLTVGVSADSEFKDWLKIDGKHIPVTFEGTAYSTGKLPAPEQNTIPAGAKVVGQTQFTANGPGNYEASVDVPNGTDPSFVTWVWKVDKASQGVNSKYVSADWSDNYGLADETTSLRHTAKVTSQIHQENTSNGTVFTDAVTVSGLPDDHPTWGGSHKFDGDAATFTQSLYFFPENVAVTDQNVTKAELIGQTTFPAKNASDLTVGSDDFVVKEGNPDGTYVFVTSFGGDSRVKPFTTSVTEKTEQFTVNNSTEPTPTANPTSAGGTSGPVPTAQGDPADAGATATPAGGLADTGANIGIIALLAAVIVAAAGAVLLLRNRKRPRK